MTSVTEDNQ